MSAAATRFAAGLVAVALLVLLAAFGMAVSPPPRDTAWPAHLGVAREALAAGDASRAIRVWHDAYAAALAARGWQPLVEVGDAFVAIGAATGSPAGARANARQAYLAALVRTQRDGSVDGALRVAEAFDALGDRAVAVQCARIAGRLAELRQDRIGMERVKAFTAARRV